MQTMKNKEAKEAGTTHLYPKPGVSTKGGSASFAKF